MKNKNRVYGLLLVVFYAMIYSLIQFVVQAGFVLYLKTCTLQSEAEIFSNFINGSYAISVISIILSLWIYILIGASIKRPVASYIYRHKIAPMGLVMVVCVAIGSRCIVTAYYHFAQKISVLKNSIEYAEAFTPETLNALQAVICLATVVIIAPMFEEFLFRGLIMGELMRIMRPWAAIVIQGILFGIAHMVLFQSLFASVIGIILGIIYHKTKCYKANVICHSIFNYSVIASSVSLDNRTAIFLIIFGVLLTASSLFYIILNCNEN